MFSRNSTGTIFWAWRDNFVGGLKVVYTPQPRPLPPPWRGSKGGRVEYNKEHWIKMDKLTVTHPPPPSPTKGGSKDTAKKWAKWLEKGLAYTTNQEPDPQWDSNPAPPGGEGYRTLIRGKEGARNHFLINTNESIRAILAPNTGKQTPPDFKKVIRRGVEPRPREDQEHLLVPLENRWETAQI